MNELSSPDAKVKQQHTWLSSKLGYSDGSCCSFRRHIDPETVCRLDYNSDRASSVGPNPTPGSVGTVTAAVPAVHAVDTVTRIISRAKRKAFVLRSREAGRNRRMLFRR